MKTLTNKSMTYEEYVLYLRQAIEPYLTWEDDEPTEEEKVKEARDKYNEGKPLRFKFE